MTETQSIANDFVFHGQRPGEKVVRMVRFHPWLLMPIVAIWLAVIIATGLLLYFLGATGFTSLAISALVLLTIIYSFYRWFIWNNGNYLITNQRVIRTEQLSLFKRQISEAEIDRIQEISTRVAGPIHTILNFGTVYVRTASGTGSVDIEDVRAPYDIQQVIAGIQRQAVGNSSQAANFTRPRMG